MYYFPRQERLKGRDEIRGVFNGKRAVACQGAKLFLLKNRLSFNRIAFTFPRKFGNAVERNRARRLCREAYRHLRQNIRTGHDLVLLIYKSDNDGFHFRASQLKELLCRAGLFNRTEQ